VVVEWHANMRFAWQARKLAGNLPTKQRSTHPLTLIMVVYNVVWWVPVILPFTGVVEYKTGSIAFLGVTIFRLAANFVRNNVVKPEMGLNFPLRSS
jgi:hypothetical protein